MRKRAEIPRSELRELLHERLLCVFLILVQINVAENYENDLFPLTKLQDVYFNYDNGLLR